VDRQGGRILLAENDPVTRDMIRLHLTDAGHVCDTVQDGHQAMEAIQRLEPDLILIEHLMPGMNGGEVLDLIRARHPESRLPVLMMLRPGEEELVAGMLQRGASDTLLKPLRMTDLLARVDKHLRACLHYRDLENRLRQARDDLVREQQRYEREKRLLRNNRRRLNKLVQISPSIVYATHARGGFRCVFVSDRLYDVMGYHVQEMLDDENFWFDHIHPQDESRITREFLEAVQRGHGKLKYRFRHHDGHYLLVEDDFEVLHDEQGQPHEIIGVWTDVADVEHLHDSVWFTPGQ